MDPDDLFGDEDLVANLDLSLLDIQKDLVRIVVLVSSVLALQGLTFLIIAWMAEGFLITVVTGLIGGVIFILGFLVWLYNFRAYTEVFLRVKDAKEDHPGIDSSEDSDSS